MAISLHNLGPKDGSKKTKKRVGRGLGSKGRTAGRGQKGQKSRAGSSGFQRLGLRKWMLAQPKLRGFKSPRPTKTAINLAKLAEVYGENEVVSPKTLVKKGLMKAAQNGVKILGDGEIKTALKIKNCSVSKSAAEKIMQAGGTIEA